MTVSPYFYEYCWRCDQDKNLDEFPKSVHEHGYKPVCKDCLREYQRQYRAKKKAEAENKT